MKMIRLIEDFLEGKLEGKEHDDFIERLAVDSAFSAEVQLHKEVNESISDEGTIQFKNQLKHLMTRKRALPVKFFIWVSAAAAIIILGFSLFSLARQPDMEKAYSDYYYPYETDLNTRSVDSKNSGINYSYYLYEKGEYNDAYKQLKDYSPLLKNNYMAIYYFGLSALELKKYDESEASLYRVAFESNSPYALHAKWYLGMLYIKTKRVDKAKAIFEMLGSEENYYSVRAKKLLNHYY